MNENSWLWQVFLGAAVWTYVIGQLVEGSMHDTGAEDAARGNADRCDIASRRRRSDCASNRETPTQLGPHDDGKVIDFKAHFRARAISHWRNQHGALADPEMIRQQAPQIKKIYLREE